MVFPPGGYGQTGKHISDPPEGSDFDWVTHPLGAGIIRQNPVYKMESLHGSDPAWTRIPPGGFLWVVFPPSPHSKLGNVPQPCIRPTKTQLEGQNITAR